MKKTVKTMAQSLDDMDLELPHDDRASMMILEDSGFCLQDLVMPRGDESTERGIRFVERFVEELDAELAGHMATLNFARENYLRQTTRTSAKYDYRRAQSSATHAAGTLDTLVFGADGEAHHHAATAPVTHAHDRSGHHLVLYHALKAFALPRYFACLTCGEVRKSASTINRTPEGIPRPRLKCSKCQVLSSSWKHLEGHRERLESIPVVGHMGKAGVPHRQDFQDRVRVFCERE